MLPLPLESAPALPTPSPPLEPTALPEFARVSPLTPSAACRGDPVSCATELPFNPHGPGPASAQARSTGCLLHILGLLTWAGRAPGCRLPAALGEAAPGTGYPAGSPRPCPPRGCGRSTGSCARLLPHSSRCRPPAGTATWGKPESGGPRGVGGFPSLPQTGKGLERFSLWESLLRLHREAQHSGQRIFRRPHFTEGDADVAARESPRAATKTQRGQK